MVVYLEKQYADLVKIIDEIEANSVKVERNTINISSLSSTQNEAQRPSFYELLDLAIKIDTNTLRILQRPKATTAPASGRPSMQVQSQSRGQQSSTVIVEQPTAAQPGASVKREMNAFASSLEVEQPAPPVQSVMVSTYKGDLILPKLTLPDQISELERIIEGLKEHVFDRSHMEIIKKEVYGLNQETIREEIERRKLSTFGQLSSIDSSLIALRDKRIIDIITLLRDQNVWEEKKQ